MDQEPPVLTLSLRVLIDTTDRAAPGGRRRTRNRCLDSPVYQELAIVRTCRVWSCSDLFELTAGRSISTTPPNVQGLFAARPRVRETWPPRCPLRTCIHLDR